MRRNLAALAFAALGLLTLPLASWGEVVDAMLMALAK